MKIGSEDHKELFCRSFMESHLEYQPEQLPWPHLDGAALERLQRIPFWEEALNTERAAGAKVDAYTAMIDDPLVRDAIALQGREEARHGRLFEFMIQHYGIEISGCPPNPLPDDIERGFIEFGYGECLDAFLGFGMFKIARQSGFLPEPMFTIFDVLLQEEARHIVFFVNWVAYLQASRGRGAKLFRAAHSLWHYGRAVKGLLELVSRSEERSSNDFAATEASVLMDDFNIEMFLSTCLEENARRMSSFDQRLLQPKLLPSLAQFARSILKLIPKRTPHTQEKDSLSKAESL